MKYIIGFFLALAAIGAFTATWLQATFSLFIAFCAYRMAKSLTRREQAWLKDPRNTQVKPDTVCMMDRQQCECMSSHSVPKFPE